MVSVVSLKISVMFLVIVAGWLARRHGFIAGGMTATLSRLVVDVAFPALVFTQMLRTVDAASLAAEWFSPLLCVLLIFVAYFAGWILSPMFVQGGQRNTFLFLVAIPNWVFLPLPIAEALYGNDGVRTVLLCNAGAQLVLWSFGVWILHGSMKQALKSLTTNTGLWATALGVAAALLFPSARELENIKPAEAGAGQIAAAALVQTLAMLGSLTIPMSLLAIGAQLGGLIVPLHRFPRALWGVLLGRLVLAPLMSAVLMWAALKTGISMTQTTWMVCFLIASMPVAISCSVMTERYKGDTALAAQGIFYSTLFSLLTVPVVVYLVQRFSMVSGGASVSLTP